VAVNAPPPTARAVRIAVVLEVLWAMFVAYESHDAYAGPFHGRVTSPWDLQLLNFGHTWAEPAIAIVAVVWFADYAARELRR
jgi:hypothetical protein